jgi:radical SAM superfamily enzyme YgiQ (UPF0313 family)
MFRKVNVKKSSKVLLAYPQYPATFWSFKHVLKFVSKKTAFPPLGLLTVAALLPDSWQKKVVDMNVSKLRDKDLAWADYVFISGMIVQKDSIKRIINRAKNFSCKVVAGGPVFTAAHEDFKDVDHFVLNEGEITIPRFLKDLEKGKPQKFYTSDERPDIKKTPLPLWDLINMKHYATMSIQYSRGCPFNCEFCDIIIMNGRVPRTKTPQQTLRELNALYKNGWRGPVFVVDDNFIGNKIHAKEMLKKLIPWMKRRDYPFALLTEASVNLADDKELLSLMIEAGFDKVFLGIETPVEESLAECGKVQNKGGNLPEAIKTIQDAGLEVMGGFIIGFDSDPPSIFKKQLEFIQKNGIVTAMVGLLNAIPGTKLYQRLQKEGRLLKNTTGNNTDGFMNFIPKMNSDNLKKNYQTLLKTIYSPSAYCERVLQFLKNYKPAIKKKPSIGDMKAFFRSIWLLGIVWRHRYYYWKLILTGIFKYPKAFSKVVSLAIYCYHFQKISRLNLAAA